MTLIITLLFFLIGSTLPAEWQDISGRDGKPVYRVDVPKGWIRSDPSPATDLSDTREAICTFSLEGVELVLHNFPDMQIPPESQVRRWQGQFDALDSFPVTIQPVAFGGYAGLSLQAQGVRRGTPSFVMAWALVLDPDHRRTLARQEGTEERRGAITIKATGAPDTLLLHRQAIEQFAESFEQIEGIRMSL